MTITKRISCLSLLIFITLLLGGANVFGQTKKFTLSGYVKDSATGETIANASISAKGTKSASTNNYGYYSLEVSEGIHIIEINMIGYVPVSRDIEIHSHLVLNFNLQVASIDKGATIIKGSKETRNVKSTEMSRVEISGADIKQLPAVLGEADVLRTITLLPGIKSGGEGGTGIYVRGGGPDQNLILIDEGVVYNPTHLLGFFSVFNADVVKNVEVIKGGIPANYGGRLSSIVSVGMKDGNNKFFQATGGIGLISSRLAVEGPIQKNKSSFVFAVRRTYIDKLIQPFLSERRKGSGYYFYDLNFKANYIISNKNRLYFSLYHGIDAFTYKSPRNANFKVNIDWGNTVASFRWNHLFSRKLFANTTVVYNTYGFTTKASFGNNFFQLYSGLKDWTGKIDFQHSVSTRHKLKYGAAYIWHTFTPGIANASQNNQALNIEIRKQYAHEGAVYIMDEWSLNDKLELNLGLRYSLFSQVGPYKKQIFNNDGSATDSFVNYAKGEQIATYHGPEPRLAARYILDKSSSIKASITRTYQYLHLATTAGSTLPTDLWIPSSKNVIPQISWQYATGYFKNFKNNEYESSVEVYYKPMQNQIEFKPGAQLFFNQNLENEVIRGKGLSYGAEFFVRKNRGDLTGWVGYTWSKTTRQFEALNYGKPYYYRYDRRHDMSLVLMYKLTKRWTSNFVFVYGSGNWLTLAEYGVLSNFGLQSGGNTPYKFSVLSLYDKLSNYKMKDYHRADISFTYTKQITKKYESSWNFSIYNIYNRANTYFIYNEPDPTTGSISWYEVYLFPILPSVTWNFKF